VSIETLALVETRTQMVGIPSRAPRSPCAADHERHPSIKVSNTSSVARRTNMDSPGRSYGVVSTQHGGGVSLIRQRSVVQVHLGQPLRTRLPPAKTLLTRNVDVSVLTARGAGGTHDSSVRRSSTTSADAGSVPEQGRPGGRPSSPNGPRTARRNGRG
jgi:hypothetical protein